MNHLSSATSVVSILKIHTKNMIQEHKLIEIERLTKELAELTGFDKFLELTETIGHYVGAVEDEFKRLKEGREEWKRKYMELKNDNPPN